MSQQKLTEEDFIDPTEGLKPPVHSHFLMGFKAFRSLNPEMAAKLKHLEDRGYVEILDGELV